MKIGYVTDYDPLDVGNWSGTGSFMAQALTRQGFDLDFIGPLARPRARWPILKAKGFIYNHVLHRRYHSGHDLSVARHFAATVDQKLREEADAELIFSPGTIPIAFLETDKPTAFWSDATHACLFDFYPEYSNLSAETIRAGHTIEQLAIDRAGAVIFSSDWAAQSAVRDYGADPQKVHVVPFGANLDHPPSPDEVTETIHRRSTRYCKLLFIGIDWERKGGDTAVAVARELNQIGLPTELTVVGCNPFHNRRQPDFVRCEGFLSKDSEDDAAQLERLLAESHFLIVPSIAECYGLVYCEANAYGVPCLAREVGGIPTVVRNDINGRLFTPAAAPVDYARYVENLFRHPQEYVDLARSSASEFRHRLNWETAGAKVREILRPLAAA